MLDSVVLKLADGQATPTDPDVIQGTSGDDYLIGTDGDDIFKSGGGVDVFHGGKGNDYYDGEGGDYTQVEFEGASTDYTFTKNQDGTITAVHAEYGTDILKNIEGAWFMGDEKWSTIDDLLPEDEVVGNTFIGTAGDDYLVGTDGNDIFEGGDGNDVFVGGKGDDIYDGEGGDYNQVDFLGNSADYTFTRNDDDTITATHAVYGIDTLKNIDGAWFAGDEIWLPSASLIGPVVDPNGVIRGTSGDDYLFGSNGNDVFVGGKGDDIYDGEGGDYNQVDFLGNSADYAFTKNQDGTVTAVHADYGTKTLSNIDGAWFIGDEKWSTINDLLPEGEVVGKILTGTAGDDYLVGTDGDDTFLGGEGNDVFIGGKGDDIYDGQGGDYNQVDFRGNSADYTFTNNADGTITAEHAEFGEDILKEIDGAWFSGDEVWQPLDDLVA